MEFEEFEERQALIALNLTPDEVEYLTNKGSCEICGHQRAFHPEKLCCEVCQSIDTKAGCQRKLNSVWSESS